MLLRRGRPCTCVLAITQDDGVTTKPSASQALLVRACLRVCAMRPDDDRPVLDETMPPTSSSSWPLPPPQDKSRPGFLQCYDPSTSQRLGEVPIMTAKDVRDLLTYI